MMSQAICSKAGLQVHKLTPFPSNNIEDNILILLAYEEITSKVEIK